MPGRISELTSYVSSGTLHPTHSLNMLSSSSHHEHVQSAPEFTVLMCGFCYFRNTCSTSGLDILRRGTRTSTARSHRQLPVVGSWNRGASDRWKITTWYMTMWRVMLMLTTHKAAWYIIFVAYGHNVCLSRDKFWKHCCTQFIHAHAVYFHGLCIDLCMKVIVSRSRTQERKGQEIILPQCKTSIGSTSYSVQHIAMKFVCSMGFSRFANRKGETAIFITSQEVNTHN